MSVSMTKPRTRDIVEEAIFTHPPDRIWSALTDGELMARWMMRPTGFAAIVGQKFTFQTTAAGAWDGTIRCEVLEVVPGERLSYAWRGGDAGNVGYGSLLDTIVTFTLIPVAVGTRLRVVHAGFELPRNDTAFTSMGEGWKKVVRRLDDAIS
ncbi:SRPBCC family protein [Niveispirillum cyanobacteriorum]|uniref:ATPase n=1 Tax=Niveispirillum cyanobacteriorum TaxID=1612173 RepID=A0A2K9N9B4_9PROT|nr:SRPBCC domain-containing protein [Niveispirillum cyanobacteriorum]AUN29708.1 ATPase [Niveispirillum cyanobacteriorum]GGE61510.1 ATPase [Niveispirillum cyanobacteriorum]